MILEFTLIRAEIKYLNSFINTKNVVSDMTLLTSWQTNFSGCV